MLDLIIIVVVLATVGAAGVFIWKEKKKGVTCIGCPAAGQCKHTCSCQTDEKNGRGIPGGRPKLGQK